MIAIKLFSKKISENFIPTLLNTILVWLSFSCTKSTDALNPQDSYRYFPIEVNDVKVYQKVTYTYAVGQKPKIDSMLLKEIVISKTENRNETTYVIERQVKRKSDFFFKPEAAFQVVTNLKQIIVGERNIYEVKLYFPIFIGAEWDINEVNGEDEKKAEIVPFDEIPENLITNKNIIKVEIDDFKSIIDWNKIYSLYSKDVGLIYSEFTKLEYCQDDACIGKDIIESGKREFLTLLEYTKTK